MVISEETKKDFIGKHVYMTVNGSGISGTIVDINELGWLMEDEVNTSNLKDPTPRTNRYFISHNNKIFMHIYD